jgi:hypothetical protein
VLHEGLVARIGMQPVKAWTHSLTHPIVYAGLRRYSISMFHQNVKPAYCFRRWHSKFAASFGSPLPLYFAACG